MGTGGMRIDALKRIVESLEALVCLSQAQKFDTIAYLISIAHLEAQETLERSAVQRSCVSTAGNSRRRVSR